MMLTDMGGDCVTAGNAGLPTTLGAPLPQGGASLQTVRLPPGVDHDVLACLASSGDEAVVATIIGVNGPSNRMAGASMVFLADGGRVGSLSSGCIEADLQTHAAAALADNRPRRLRYGRGSPWIDLPLPCGGGIDVWLAPRPGAARYRAATAELAARRVAVLAVGGEGPGLPPTDVAAPFLAHVAYTPQLSLRIFGSGAEPLHFVRAAGALGYPARLYVDGERPGPGERAGLHAHAYAPGMTGLDFDRWTPVVLLFHDHDHEIDVLVQALKSDAAYIGARGSRSAAERRTSLLRPLVPAADLARVRSPIGLIPAARDPQTMAISILAEIAAVYKNEEN